MVMEAGAVGEVGEGSGFPFALSLWALWLVVEKVTGDLDWFQYFWEARRGGGGDGSRFSFCFTCHLFCDTICSLGLCYLQIHTL